MSQQFSVDCSNVNLIIAFLTESNKRKMSAYVHRENSLRKGLSFWKIWFQGPFNSGKQGGFF
jgi:hypothetical protein